MARLARLYAPQVVQRVVQRAAPGRTLAADVDDGRVFIDILADAVRTHDVALHAWVLLPTEFQLVATPATAEGLPRAMQAIGRRYAPYVNAKSGRMGRIWGARYRSTLLDADRHLFDAMRMVEGAPVTAGLASRSIEWMWSSHRHHVGAEAQAFVTDHALYWRLRDTPFERQAAYASLTDVPLARVEHARIDDATEKGWALGSGAFLATLTPTRRALPLSRGRPRKPTTPAPRSVPINGIQLE